MSFGMLGNCWLHCLRCGQPSGCAENQNNERKARIIFRSAGLRDKNIQGGATRFLQRFLLKRKQNCVMEYRYVCVVGHNPQTDLPKILPILII
jgi:hypothetical protein